MYSSLERVVAMFPEVYDQSKWNMQETLAILKGTAGFSTGIGKKNQAESIGAVVGMAGHFAQKCSLGALQQHLGQIEQWMNFGEEYAAHNDPSDLDFEKINIQSVPEVMQVNWREFPVTSISP